MIDSCWNKLQFTGFSDVQSVLVDRNYQNTIFLSDMYYLNAIQIIGDRTRIGIYRIYRFHHYEIRDSKSQRFKGWYYNFPIWEIITRIDNTAWKFYCENVITPLKVDVDTGKRKGRLRMRAGNERNIFLFFRIPGRIREKIIIERLENYLLKNEELVRL